YRSSDIFVFPSYSEGNPKAPMEALANSLPVVCTESGCSNYIINEFNGIIVNTADVEDLVIGIIKMMTNNFLRQQCISNGIQTAINNTRETIQFNLSKFIQNYY
ncbi:MAG: glycosyltransferase, partial [Candidatus Riesia sp.]|nr:glycosyltransferase [Candidatus Riesia sp.]